ncbi:MAG TPA: hypothetical protein PLY87_12990 [Planctomycetaceae bacterium]|nr:hypothetical protein [Planctomycetaceae bacterium]
MTTSHGRRIQSRRALAIMAWVSLVIIAALLWYGQEKNIIRIQAWEPAALLLSAYSAFLAIFGWLLFAPERKSAEESPALFFSGMLTLIPPCFIAYHLMPPSSPIRGWLTLGIFVFGLIAILSPLPDEVFAVPRNRKSYLQPLTDCYLSILDVEEPQLEFEGLVPRSYRILTENITPELPPLSDSSGGVRDPWTDPFYGTGRQLSEVGGARRAKSSTSRTQISDVRSDHASPQSVALHRAGEESLDAGNREYRDLSRNPSPNSDPSFVPRTASLPPQVLSRPMTEVQDDLRSRAARNPQEQRPDAFPAPPLPQTTLPSSTARRSDTTRPPMAARSAFAPRESRTPNYQPPVPAADHDSTRVDRSVSSAAPTTRRPLTDPYETTKSAVGFQSPPASRTLPSRPTSTVPDPSSGLTPLGSVPSLASAATYDDVLKSAVSEFRTLTGAPSSNPAPQLDTSAGLGSASPARRVARPSESPLRELDRRMKQREADDGRDDEARSLTDVRYDSAHSSQVQSATSSRLNDIRMERIKDEFGGEMIDGTIQVFFEVGQKRAHLHVPFSPPLPGVPEVECEPISDDAVRLKVGVRQPYGIRIEARRSDAAQALNTEIGFGVVYTPTARKT